MPRRRRDDARSLKLWACQCQSFCCTSSILMQWNASDLIHWKTTFPLLALQIFIPWPSRSRFRNPYCNGGKKTNSYFPSYGYIYYSLSRSRCRHQSFSNGHDEDVRVRISISTQKNNSEQTKHRVLKLDIKLWKQDALLKVAPLRFQFLSRNFFRKDTLPCFVLWRYASENCGVKFALYPDLLRSS